MNCSEVQRHLLADRDASLHDATRVTIDAHVAHCGDCQQVRDHLAAALGHWRQQTAATPVPDIDREWFAVRRRIRGGVDTTATAEAHARRRRFAWLAVPLGAAAALAVTFFIDPANRRSGDAAEGGAPLVRRDTAAPAGDPSTLVFVDDKSGWLVVWSSPSGSGRL